MDGQTDGQMDGLTDRQNYDRQDRASIAASRDKNHLTLVSAPDQGDFLEFRCQSDRAKS